MPEPDYAACVARSQVSDDFYVYLFIIQTHELCAAHWMKARSGEHDLAMTLLLHVRVNSGHRTRQESSTDLRLVSYIYWKYSELDQFFGSLAACCIWCKAIFKDILVKWNEEILCSFGLLSASNGHRA